MTGIVIMLGLVARVINKEPIEADASLAVLMFVALASAIISDVCVIAIATSCVFGAM